MKYKMYLGNILVCTKYNVREVDVNRNGVDDFSKGYRLVDINGELVQSKALLIKLANGKYLKYSDTIGLNNILNKLRLYQSDGPSVLQQQGYILRDTPNKKGEQYVDTDSLELYKGTEKKAKSYVKKKRDN